MADDQPRRRAWRTDEEWTRLRARIAESEPVPGVGQPAPHRRWVWGLAAAAVIVATAIPLTLRLRPAGDARVIVTSPGERRVVQSGDSSTVTLGPASTLRFTATTRRREVSLDGMADFRVVHDARRPFVIRARDAVATDLGTAFTVRAYATDSVVRVSVAEGAVALTNRAASSSGVTLRAGDVGVVAPREVAVVPRGNAAIDRAWVDGSLSFDDEPLSHVAAELGRWFDVEISVADPAVARRRVTALYSTPTLSGVLEALGATAGVEAVRNGRTILLRSRSR